MNKFSEAYAKARTVVTSQVFASDWQKFLTDKVNLKGLLDADGPNLAHAAGLAKLRAELAKSKRGAFKRFFMGSGVAEAIVEAAKNDDSGGKMAERAATLKMTKHLYLGRKRGGQDVWIYAPPKAYATWIFDEIKGQERSIKPKLGKETEVYSESERGIMCDALLLALNWSENVVAKLGAADDKTKAVVKRWFADEDTTEDQITTAIDTLKEGFKKVVNVANSNKLVFSDEPLDRNKGGWKDWAFVYKTETMDVVYLQGAFLKSGNTGKLWMCALTIIHEITHRAVATNDHRYDTSGLKPAKGTLPHAKAIDNADSWAYFATDLAGKLSTGDRNKVLV